MTSCHTSCLCPQKLQLPRSRGNDIFLLQRHRVRITPHLARVLRPLDLSGLPDGHSTSAGDAAATHRCSCRTCALSMLPSRRTAAPFCPLPPEASPFRTCPVPAAVDCPGRCIPEVSECLCLRLSVTGYARTLRPPAASAETREGSGFPSARHLSTGPETQSGLNKCPLKR